MRQQRHDETGLDGTDESRGSLRGKKEGNLGLKCQVGSERQAAGSTTLLHAVRNETAQAEQKVVRIEFRWWGRQARDKAEPWPPLALQRSWPEPDFDAPVELSS